MSKDLHSGHSYPLGATVTSEGINFCLFSRHAAAVDLLLFDDVEESKPSRTIRLDRHRNKTANYWHLFVPGLVTGQVYGYRVHGPYDPKRGLRFDGNKVLLDPYTRAVAVSKRYDRAAAIRPGDNCAAALKSVVVDTDTYDWKGDEPLRRPYSETLIYEMHVGGFTRNPNSGVAVDKRGTYAGLIEKIPYLKSLGITAVELQPVQQFDDQDAPGGLTNYWGYSPVAFFAPHSGFSSRRDPIGPVSEFRDMVAALHKAGIEVILDVVFNHTAEGNHQGPTFSFKGIEDGAYYMLDQKGSYLNYTGCGNTINANYSIVRRLIMDCLRHWVSTMHVDGFRFDLASVLSRDEKGVPLLSPPVLWVFRRRPLPRMERPVPRRCPTVCQRGERHRGINGEPGPRQPGHLPGLFPQVNQLRHLPRRLHHERSCILQHQEERGQPPEEHRRRRLQRQLELRGGGAVRPGGNRQPPRAADEELLHGPYAVARNAHAAHGR